MNRIDVGFHNIRPLIDAKKWEEAVNKRLQHYPGNEFLLVVKANLIETIRWQRNPVEVYDQTKHGALKDQHFAKERNGQYVMETLSGQIVYVPETNPSVQRLIEYQERCKRNAAIYNSKRIRT